LNIGYDNKTVEELTTVKLLGLQIDNNFNWRKLLKILFQNSVHYALL
jgi:hypothetical protein